MVTSLANNNNNSVYSETHGDDVQKESPSRPQPESHSNSSPYEYNSGASYNRQQSRAYWGSNAGMSNQWQYYNPSSEMMYPHHAYYSQHEGSYPSYRSQQHPNYATPYGPPSAYSYGTYSATSAAIQSPSKRRRVMDESATETNHDPVAHYIPNSTKSTSRHKTSPGNHHFSFDEPLKIPNSTTKSTSRHKTSPGNHHFTFDDPLHDMEPAPLTGSASGTTPYDDVDYSTAPYPYYNGSAAAAAAQSYTYPTSSYHYHTNHLHQDVDHHSNYYHYQNGHPYYHQHNGHNNPNSPKVLVSPDTQSNKTELDKLRHDNPFEGLDNNNNSNDNVNHDGENGIQHPAAPSPMNKSSKLSDRKAMQSKAWYDRFEDLKKYKEEHGDCMVPQKYPPNPSLGIWVNKQRMEYKLLVDNEKSSMSPDRLAALKSIGFVWAKRKGQATWDTKYQQLLEYKLQYGDCLIPTKYSKNPALGRWVSTQREHYRMRRNGDPRSKMTDEKIRLLDSIGFVWRLQF